MKRSFILNRVCGTTVLAALCISVIGCQGHRQPIGNNELYILVPPDPSYATMPEDYANDPQAREAYWEGHAIGVHRGRLMYPNDERGFWNYVPPEFYSIDSNDPRVLRIQEARKQGISDGVLFMKQTWHDVFEADNATGQISDTHTNDGEDDETDTDP